jgi:hypothetical protein
MCSWMRWPNGTEVGCWSFSLNGPVNSPQLAIHPRNGLTLKATFVCNYLTEIKGWFVLVVFQKRLQPGLMLVNRKSHNWLESTWLLS